MTTMTLAEAIEEVRQNHDGRDFEWHEFENENFKHPELAIATILNAVVKGELKYE